MPTETRSPTATEVELPGWENPTNAYASDDSRAFAPRGLKCIQRYLNYGFNIPLGATIYSVEVGLEGFVDYGDEWVAFMISDGTGFWDNVGSITWLSEEFQWRPSTVIAWTPAKVNALRTKICYDFIAGGCYPKNTVLIIYDQTKKQHELKIPTEVKNGDKALAWSIEKGFFYTTITAIQQHTGTWKMLDLYSGESEYGTFKWKKHLEVTENHPIWSPQRLTRIPARAFKVGDYLSHLHKGKLIVLPITEIKTRGFVGTVYNYQKEDPDCHLFMKSLSNEELETLASEGIAWKNVGDFDAIVMDIKEGSGHVDWIPVRVVWTEGPPPTVIPKRKLLGVGR